MVEIANARALPASLGYLLNNLLQHRVLPLGGLVDTLAYTLSLHCFGMDVKLTRRLLRLLTEKEER
jgi:hypothetical protein